MEISVGVDLSECETVFFLIPYNGLNPISVKAIEKLQNIGVEYITTVNIQQASELLATLQQKYGCIPLNQKFLKLTSNRIELLFK